MQLLTIGDRVRHRFHNDRSHAGWIGYVAAIETYTDGNGTRTWYYVRWLDPHGKVLSEPDKFDRTEIEREAT